LSTLFVVGTPIGNLEDISPRAKRTLQAVSLIAAEDTRTARQLLGHLDIHTPLTSYYEHNKLAKLDRILETLERSDVAVVSEAGMPGINDPGYELVRAAIDAGHTVSPVPGPSAVLAALVGSGLAADSFLYLGFLPREPRARRRLLQEVADESTTLVMFEAPHRLRRALEDMETAFGARSMCAARELTKRYEEFVRGTIPQVREHWRVNEPRGEFTLVVEGQSPAARPRAAAERWDDARVIEQVQRLLAQGVPRTEAVKRVARQSRRDRRAVYELTLE
jgi:16S rRNA (cytidine1402-2'-O)-methyltransferase